MKQPKQLCFSFIKKNRNTDWLEKPFRFCKRFSALLLALEFVFSLGRIWILTL